jgi:hypothetical protein
MTETTGQSGLVNRARAILTTPKTEWPVIDAEPATIADIYTKYVLILAAIPAVAGFLSSSIIGISVPFGGTMRMPFMAGLSNALVGYVLSLVGLFIIALIIDALAPTFGGTKNQIQAMKAAAYSYTAFWVASAFQIIPVIGWLVSLAGLIYGLYLLYLGLPVVMKSPADKALGYTAVVIVCAFVISLILGLITASLVGGPSMMNRGMMGSAGGSGGAQTQFQSDSPLGRLEQWANRMEQASDNMERAQESGDAGAQEQALNDFMGTLFGNDGSVEALSP